MLDYLIPDSLGNLSSMSVASVGSVILKAAGTGAAAYPTANQAIFVPFRIAHPIVVTQLFALVNSSSGNIDMGIYDAFGTKIVSIGSTAMAGSSVLQAFNITDTKIGPGLFYLAIALDNNTGQLIRVTFTAAAAMKALGLAEMATAFALPATATFATAASNYLPIIGLTTRSSVL